MTLRTLFLLLLSCSVLQAQTNFPAALAPPRLISAPEFGNPPRHQWQITVGTGPDMSVVAWADNRAGRDTLFVARVANDGTILDPLGLPIHDDARPDAVVWNGEDFLIAGRIHDFGNEGSSTLFARLSTDGVVLEKMIRRIGRGAQVAAVSGSGPNARILYFDGSAFLFDGFGNLVREQPLSPPVGGDWIAGSHGSGEFLFLRSFGQRVISQRLARDGSWLSSLESNLPVGAQRGVVVGKGDGYLLFTVGRGTDIHFLDKGGVWTGKKTTLLIGLLNGANGPRHKPLFVEDRFLASWFEPAADGGWDTYYGEISEEGALMVRERVTGRSGHPWETQVVATSSGARLLVTAFWEHLVATGTDLTIQKITPPRSSSSLLTVAASEQSGVAVAAGGEGFGVVWMERGSEASLRLMFRTLSSRGEASSEPIEVARESCCEINAYQQPLQSFATASNGRTFLIAWVQRGALLARRYLSGQGWLDAEPIVIDRGLLDFRQQSLASNGDDFLATWAQGFEVMVRRFPAMGSMEGLATQISDTRWNYQPAVASDGKDYFVVWSEGERVCNTLCNLPPLRMLAARVAANGMPIDASPMILEAGKYRQVPSVAWDGENYVVVNNPGPFGMRVSRDGTILERLPDGTGTRLRLSPTPSNSIGVVAAAEGGVLLLTSDLSEPSRGHWNGLLIRAETPLSSVSAIPSHRIVDDAYGESVPVYVPIHSLSVAHRGSTYLFGFVRVADANIGRGFRVFTHLRGQPARPRGLRR